jgi:tRNA dimethylallyltransferase
MGSKRPLIVIGGPTGVGKTAAAIAVAQKINAEIISADSRQVYQQMSIGTGRPSPEELAAVPHHLLGHVDIHRHYNASDFEREALICLQDIWARGRQAIVCGGTGLYIQTLCDGMDEMPPADMQIRNELEERFSQEGIDFLQDYIESHDPDLISQIDMQNQKRLIRAVEVMMVSSQPYSSFRKGGKVERDFEPVYFCLNLPQEELYARIRQRVLKMIADHWEEEARRLYPERHLKALHTVGYRELFDYFDGKTDLATAIDLIQTHTSQYARRQLTWFRRDSRYVWVSSAHEMLDKLSEFGLR